MNYILAAKRQRSATGGWFDNSVKSRIGNFKFCKKQEFDVFLEK
jgi:hypothetical protein